MILNPVNTSEKYDSLYEQTLSYMYAGSWSTRNKSDTYICGVNLDGEYTGGIGSVYIIVPFACACYGSSGSYKTMAANFTVNQSVTRGVEYEEIVPGVYLVTKLQDYYKDYTNDGANIGFNASFPNTVAGTGNNKYRASTTNGFLLDEKPW